MLHAMNAITIGFITLDTNAARSDKSVKSTYSATRFTRRHETEDTPTTSNKWLYRVAPLSPSNLFL